MAITIEMPRLSDSMHEGTVLRWFKKTGDFVKVGDHLADIETDKAHVELQACEDGTLTEILVPEGGSAAAGAPIALLQPEFGAAVCGCPPRPSATCSPLAARLAAEAGLNPATLRGTGPRGKIMAADVRAALRPADGPARRVQTPLAPRDTRHATRVDNFYLYSLEANMAYLAAIHGDVVNRLAGGVFNEDVFFPLVQHHEQSEMPHSIISIGGTTPKTGIEAGRPVSKLILPVTLYVNAGILPECKASNIAAEFKTLLENPVLLLL